MFFKETRSRKSGKPVLQLVESRRIDKGPRNYVIVSLGTEFDVPSHLRQQVASCVKGRLLGESIMFEEDQVSLYADRIVKKIQTEGKWQKSHDKLKEVENTKKDRETAEVYINELQHANSRELGTVLIGHHFWRMLKFPRILRACGFNQSQVVTAEISVLNRLIAQDSEHAIIDWLNTVALDELSGVDTTNFGDDRFYRISDFLINNQTDIETALYKQEASLFNLENSIFLYDLTNTYFEGQAKKNPKAEYGGNQKEKRDDCPQVVVALVIDSHGFIRRHRMFNGKMKDAKSLSYILEELAAEFKDSEMPTLIFDRGVVSKDNIEMINNYKYIIACRTNEEMEFVEEFEQGEFVPISGRKEKKKSEVKILLKKKDGISYLLCKSEGRKKKEKAMRNHQEQKLIDELENIARQIKKSSSHDTTGIDRRLGRLMQKYCTVAKYYWFKYEPFVFSVTYPDEQINRNLKKSLDTISRKYRESKISYNELQKQLESRQEKYPLDYEKLDIQITVPSLQWGTEEDKENNQHQLEGNYLLKTNRTDLQSEEIWNIYTMLTKVEKAFRDLKTHLGLRPNYHQLEKRVDGHIFISILAYHLLHTIEYVLNQQGISTSWKTIKRLVSTHTYSTIQIPTVNKTTINIRKPGAVEGIHQHIYRKLGVNYKDLPILKTTAK
jgi:hypothetical protein